MLHICLDRCLDRAWIGDAVYAKTMVGVTLLLGSGLDRRPVCAKPTVGVILFCSDRAWIGDPVFAKTMVGVTLLLGWGL